ncbi:hypothetical protein CJF32_00007024 [Rutstroemia sp. NJR-2017a WRK4]|nr:hypothetical protein CJF32_00007024 [Rutstroemia sp. NJR-2017a WRK4]
MSSRFNSTLHQRDPRSALFENYNGGSPARAASASPARGYGYPGTGVGAESGNAYGGFRAATPNIACVGWDGMRWGELGGGDARIRMDGSELVCEGMEKRNRKEKANAQTSHRGQYSDAVLNELESQNDEQVEGIMGKVKQLKTMTIAIGDEIRESSALAEKMNDSFENTRVRIRGTMNRMLIMSQKTGVSWKVWLMFFAAVFGLFFWVWVR